MTFIILRMKILLRLILLLGGVFLMVLALGFAYQVPLAIQVWPWSVSPLTYLFIGSILAAVSVAMLWIGWTEEYGILPALAQRSRAAAQFPGVRSGFDLSLSAFV